MAKIQFVAYNNVVVAEADVTSVTTTDPTTITAIFDQWKSEAGITGTDGRLASGLDADDTAWYWTSTVVVPKYKIPMLSAFMYSSESQFGFFSQAPTGSQNSLSGMYKSRAYAIAPTPPLLISTAPPSQDCRLTNGEIWSKNGVLLVKGRHSHYNGGGTVYDFAIKITATTITIVMKKVSVSSTWDIYADTFSVDSNRTSKVNSYKLGTAFSGGDTTTITLNFVSQYKPSGSWRSPAIPLTNVKSYASSTISLVEDKPPGTNIAVSAVITDNTTPPESFIPVTNGGSLPGIEEGADLSSKYLWLKVDLSTSDITVSPKVSNLKAVVVSAADNRFLLLHIDPLQRFNNVEGDLTVSYDQSKGTLSGEGGAVQSFTRTFTPVDLESARKPNPHHAENITVANTVITINFKPVRYTRVEQHSGDRDTIRATFLGATVTLTPVGIINP